jgi:hypothetical protein
MALTIWSVIRPGSEIPSAPLPSQALNCGGDLRARLLDHVVDVVRPIVLEGHDDEDRRSDLGQTDNLGGSRRPAASVVVGQGLHLAERPYAPVDYERPFRVDLAADERDVLGPDQGKQPRDRQLVVHRDPRRFQDLNAFHHELARIVRRRRVSKLARGKHRDNRDEPRQVVGQSRNRRQRRSSGDDVGLAAEARRPPHRSWRKVGYNALEVEAVSVVKHRLDVRVPRPPTRFGKHLCHDFDEPQMALLKRSQLSHVPAPVASRSPRSFPRAARASARACSGSQR